MWRIFLIFLAMARPLAAEEQVAFFGIVMLDSSLQTMTLGEAPEDAARLEMITEMVRDHFTNAGLVLMDLEPVKEELDRVVNPAKCYGCDTRMGTKLGADFVLVGEVQKVSNLILTMNLQMRDATSGELVKGRVVDIRGNTDDSWRRGMRYILKTAFFGRE